MSRIKFLFVILSLCCTLFVTARDEHYQYATKIIVAEGDTSSMKFLHDSSMYRDGWDTLPQTLFWRDVISMTSDTCVINIAYCRKPVNRINRLVWMNQTETQKTFYKDSLCRACGLDSATNLYVTAGKGEFYEVKKVLPDIHEAIDVFLKNNCDPWYAQAILLIESPGKKKSKSYVGANGPFQLMRSVAIKYGLKVSPNNDERSSLAKSAKAASSLINKSCIPYIKKFLDAHCVEYKETDLWFRLLVLHAYHAGPGNVACVIDNISPTRGGVELFQKIWQTECRGFKNESQNYSQIALASLINFDKLLHIDGDTVFLITGDRLMRNFSRSSLSAYDAYDHLNKSMAAYEQDFIDNVISFEYFIKRINRIRDEYSHLARLITKGEREINLKKYPAAEDHILALANTLSKRQRYEDAIKILKINLDINPSSVSTYDSIARLYKLTGDMKNAELYSSRSEKASREQSR